MNTQNFVAIFLIVIGTIGLAYGGFSRTNEVHSADRDELHMSFSGQKQANLPMWAGVAFIVVGGILVIIRK